MSKNSTQKFSRIIEKHVEKLTEIKLIKILDHNSTVIVDFSIEFCIIVTIFQKIDFFAQKRWFYAVYSTLMKWNEFEITTLSIDSAIQKQKQNDAMNANKFMKFDIDLQNVKTNINNWKV